AVLFFSPPGRPKVKKAPSGGSKPGGRSVGVFFSPQGRPKVKKPPRGAASRRRSVGALFPPPGRPKAKKPPRGAASRRRSNSNSIGGGGHDLGHDPHAQPQRQRRAHAALPLGSAAMIDFACFHLRHDAARTLVIGR